MNEIQDPFHIARHLFYAARGARSAASAELYDRARALVMEAIWFQAEEDYLDRLRELGASPNAS